jgi:hypothetical protein
VVPKERNQPASTGKGDELIEDTAALSASVDVVSQGNHGIFSAGPNGDDQGVQGI